MTMQEALRAAVAELSAGAESPQAEAEELLGRLLGLSRTEIHLNGARLVSPEQARTLAEWIERRRAGEPIQYITGRAAFRGLDLEVGPDVLVPRPETEGLVERVLEILRAERQRWPAPRVLDLGTGSGAIALAIASEMPRTILTATDVSAAALVVARRNAAALGLASRVRLLGGSWFAALEENERFEVIISNPPYISEWERESLPREVRDHEPAPGLFSGPTGLEALREIVERAPRHLAPEGWLALEVADARASHVLAWLTGARDWEEARLEEDLSGRPRVALARRRAQWW